MSSSTDKRLLEIQAALVRNVYQDWASARPSYVDTVYFLQDYKFGDPNLGNYEVRSPLRDDVAVYLPIPGPGKTYPVERLPLYDANGKDYLQVRPLPYGQQGSTWNSVLEGTISQLHFRFEDVTQKVLVSDERILFGLNKWIINDHMRVFKVPAVSPAGYKFCAQLNLKHSDLGNRFVVFWCWPDD